MLGNGLEAGGGHSYQHLGPAAGANGNSSRDFVHWLQRLKLPKIIVVVLVMLCIVPLFTHYYLSKVMSCSFVCLFGITSYNQTTCFIFNILVALLLIFLTYNVLNTHINVHISILHKHHSNS